MATEKRIQAKLEAPSVLHLPSGDPTGTVELEVLCRLHNTGDDDYLVGCAHAHGVHAWHVLDQQHREVARPPREEADEGKEGVHPYVSRAIIAGHSHNEPRTLTLNARKLKAGGTYRIRYEFWGEIAEAEFTVLPAPGTAPARSRPKQPATKAAPKKAAPKRATRKAAPKKAAKKATKTAPKKTAKKSAPKKATRPAAKKARRPAKRASKTKK